MTRTSDTDSNTADHLLQQDAERNRIRIKQLQAWLAIEDEQDRVKAIFDGTQEELKKLHADALTHCEAQLTTLQYIEAAIKRLEENGEVRTQSVTEYLSSIQPQLAE